MWCPALCREQTQLGKGKTRPLCFYIRAGGDLESSLQRTVHVTFQIGIISIREESQQELDSENILVYKRVTADITADLGPVKGKLDVCCFSLTWFQISL